GKCNIVARDSSFSGKVLRWRCEECFADASDGVASSRETFKVLSAHPQGCSLWIPECCEPMPSLGLRQLIPLVILLAIGSAVVSEPRALAGSGLLSWDLPSTDDPGGAHLGGSAPAASDPV